MNLKDRTNLLKDSCARIPYGVKCQCFGRIGTIRSIDTFGNTEVEGFNGSFVIDVSHVKPYLFPLSSMTPKQKSELSMLIADSEGMFDSVLIEIDFYHKHHIDYRDLIPMGLAIDATNLNIY